MGAAAALEGGAARQLGCFEGRPLGEAVAADGGVFVVEPLEDVGEVVLQGTGQASREAHVVAAQTTAMFDKLFEGPHRGAVGLAGLELVAMLAPERKRAFGVRGIVRGVAGRAGVAVRGQGQRIDGAHDQTCGFAQGLDEWALIEREAHGNGAAFERRS
jgi:hypothetical protein